MGADEWEACKLVAVGAKGWAVRTPPRAERDRLIEAGEPCTVRRIAVLEESHYTPIEECEANAKLMAAAPLLLAALRHVLQSEVTVFAPFHKEMVEAAIAKAEGK